MTEFTQKYTLLAPLEELREGTEYNWKDWPLHVTLADVFAVDWDKNNLREKLASTLSRQKPVTATADYDEYFGPEKQTQVTILDMSKELAALHCDIVALLKDAGVVFNVPEYVEDGYRPHATVQKHARLHLGEKVTLDTVCIIDMFPNNDPYQRRVLKTIKLAGVQH